MTKKRRAWGDREGRTRDVLDAAREVMEERGFLDLNMREVARRAGVALGTVYVCFHNKEEVFLTLYAERMDQLSAEAREQCLEASDLRDMIRRFADAYLRFYREYGRYLSVWALRADAAAVEDIPEDLRQRLQSSVMLLYSNLRQRADQLARDEDLRLLDDALVMPLLWSVMTGLAENSTGPKAIIHPYRYEEIVEFAAGVLVAGLTTPLLSGIDAPRP